ncbi:hypothetical protein M409DRAFT_65241 [Zasmidium cellare ATCC 36951]|uniref:Uncharacterized protein n=1 Tax=Zasmidium cellare ATCC 36951 TaxID=1080233 RepID=A0A6A6CRW0_ZASCE|nr:uncharacterized protein M409DRAFT_65241 [Zasmidium cellare ATCC 36951]KAF2168880.1 hypothetical protein M409DRAFT_65241 [Zasmidium cellare ATCC 36951]
MWLINTTTLALHEFLPETTPPYGILSHRWESVEQEVSFKEFRKSRGQDTKGYMKIENFCKLLQEHDIDWAWVDTCCIDKRSSAEISEAINSMYRYYKNASTCYVYLKDASCGENDWLRSEWWRRGWTLQELVAASPVFFYDCNWKYISSKHSARETIAQCTRIPEDILSGQCRPRVYTAAQKMSWASCRETTRVEDMAYCMLGLFDINMPLLYGEGENAFRRLQLEILQKDADESLFAWNSTLPNSGEVLALLPARKV